MNSLVLIATLFCYNCDKSEPTLSSTTVITCCTCCPDCQCGPNCPCSKDNEVKHKKHHKKEHSLLKKYKEKKRK
jgi:hypothetical protein